MEGRGSRKGAAATKGAGGDVKTWFGKQVSAQASVSEDGCMEVDDKCKPGPTWQRADEVTTSSAATNFY